MTLACQDIDDLLPAFALDALEPAERLDVLEHLAECRAHDAELADYRVTLSYLPSVLAAPAPPSSLREGLLREFDAQQAGATAPMPAEPARRGFWGLLLRPGLAYGLAAALVLAVAGLAAWNVSLQGKDEGTRVVQTSVRSGDYSLSVRYLPEFGVATFDVAAPALPAGQVYQAWKIEGGRPVSLGLISGNRGQTAFAADLSGAAAVAISIEPAGGSATPTTVVALSEF